MLDVALERWFPRLLVNTQGTHLDVPGSIFGMIRLNHREAERHRIRLGLSHSTSDMILLSRKGWVFHQDRSSLHEMFRNTYPAFS